MAPRRRKTRTQVPAAYQWPTLIILLIVTVFLVNGAWEVHKKADRAQERRDQTQAELAEYSEQKAALEADINALRSERGVEEQIREKYSVVKEGEEVVVIVDESQGRNRQEEGTEDGSWWSSLTNFFGF